MCCSVRATFECFMLSCKDTLFTDLLHVGQKERTYVRSTVQLRTEFKHNFAAHINSLGSNLLVSCL